MTRGLRRIYGIVNHEQEPGIYIFQTSHIQYQQQSIRNIYDYYSIGIVLLELGSWSPLEEFINNTRGKASDPSAFRDILINKYALRLRSRMGERYTDAVLACLRSEFQEFEGMQKQTVLGEFFDKVVGPLGEFSEYRI